MTSQRLDSSDYRQIFLSEAPLVDLRAPCEFELGAFPESVSLPLMTDSEREQVGICYKRKGQQSAIELGHQLVSGEIKNERIQKWIAAATSNLDSIYFYCFRGGLRSKTTQNWLADAGVHVPIVQGGYKAMRRFLIDETERLVEKNTIKILTGLTGSAKTKILLNKSIAIDLEGLANHRGSSFGRRVTAQPSQINFENNLAIALMKHESMKMNCLLLEDESRLIGSRALPLILKEKMEGADLIRVEESLEYRIEHIFQDYVVLMLEEFKSIEPQEYITDYHRFLVDSTTRIKKRLGGVGYQEMLTIIEKAIVRQKDADDLTLHKDWIKYLLEKYYDPMYRYQLEKKKQRIIFSGDTSAVTDYINQL